MTETAEFRQLNDIIISGFGGQGVLFAGKVLAEWFLGNGLEVTWLPSYGPEMRGGACSCFVRSNKNPIGAPLIRSPDFFLALSIPAAEKYIPQYGKESKTKIFLSSDVVKYIPEITENIKNIVIIDGSEQPLNMFFLGYLLREITAKPPYEDSLLKKAAISANNLSAIGRGWEAASQQACGK